MLGHGMRISSLVILLVVPIAFVGADEQRPSGQQTARKLEEIERRLERRAARYEPLVEAFYRYDVGTLRGAAAVRAKRAWDRLSDPAAIPAIVRGLNQAVHQGASCPIVAFASKLRQLLRRADDPELGAYVLRHLTSTRGPFRYHVDRARRAAHQQLLRTKLRQYGRQQLLRRMKKRPQSVARGDADLLRMLRAEDTQASADQSSPSTEAASPSAGTASGASLQELLERLAHGKLSQADLRRLEHASRTAQAAALAADARLLLKAAANPQLPLSHRRTAVRILGRLRLRRAVPVLIELLSERNGLLRRDAATALSRITRRLFGPAPGASEEEVKQAVQRWRRWWQKHGSKEDQGAGH